MCHRKTRLVEIENRKRDHFSGVVGPEGRKHDYYFTKTRRFREKQHYRYTYKEQGPCMIMVGTTLLVSDWTEPEL